MFGNFPPPVAKSDALPRRATLDVFKSYDNVGLQESALASFNALDINKPDYIAHHSLTSSNISDTTISGSPPSYLAHLERADMIRRAELLCYEATEISSHPEAERAKRLFTILSKFGAIMKQSAVDRNVESLAADHSINYSELDLCNAIMHLNSHDDRVRLWLALTDLYPVHANGARSDSEIKQLTNFFFNSVYIDHQASHQRTCELAQQLITGIDARDNLKYVAAQLQCVTDANERSFVIKGLILRINQSKIEYRQGALMSFLQMLPRLGIGRAEFESMTKLITTLMGSSAAEYRIMAHDWSRAMVQHLPDYGAAS